MNPWHGTKSSTYMSNPIFLDQAHLGVHLFRYTYAEPEPLGEHGVLPIFG